MPEQGAWRHASRIEKRLRPWNHCCWGLRLAPTTPATPTDAAPAWRLLDERKNGSTSPLAQYVWHPYYIDAMERFFWSLKHEWTKHEHFENLEDARLSMFKYIETFYNRERLHQTLNYKTPNQFEADHAPANAA